MPAQSLTIRKHCRLKAKKDALLTWYTLTLVRKDGSVCLLTTNRLFQHDVEHLLYDLSYTLKDERAINTITRANRLRYEDAQDYVDAQNQTATLYKICYCNREWREKGIVSKGTQAAYLAAVKVENKCELKYLNFGFDLDAWNTLLDLNSDSFAFHVKVTLNNCEVVCESI